MDLPEIVYYDRAPEYNDFLQNHLIPNTPALFSADFTSNWKARKEWVVPNPDASENNPKSIPNFALLRSRFAQAQVPVARCHEKHFTDQERMTMSFEDFCSFWASETNQGYYLKDWHFVKAFTKEEAYEVPELFKDDWLNAYWLHNSEDDYRFSYMGEHGTFTPMHADVYRSFSWSSNICGIKKWTMFPPDQEEKLKDNLGNLVYDIRKVDLLEFPEFEKAKKIVVYQKDGETLFVPSGWFHQVENIGATISINHNWCNSTNLYLTYKSLNKDYEDVKEAIDDLKSLMSDKDFMEECQKLLFMHSGWNWATFLSILHYITLNYITECEYQPDVEWQLSKVKEVIDSWTRKDGKELTHYLEQNPDLHKKYIQLQSALEKKDTTTMFKQVTH